MFIPASSEAHGISAFYGSLEEGTSISEARPIVGQIVVTAIFKPVSKLKLLDLTEELKKEQKYDFLDKQSSSYDQAIVCFSRIINDISKPAINQPDLEYMPGQMFFEYLRTKFSSCVEGIIFPSIQTSCEGKNIILFPEKSRVDACSSSPVLCLNHLHYEEHIEYIPDSLNFHKVKKITNDCVSFDEWGKFPVSGFDIVKGKIW